MSGSGTLPIFEGREALLQALREHRRVVLAAPTGSGKSTQVPGMILDAGLAGEGRVVVLQPRRVAARSLARRVASERGVALGREVGYQVRFEDRVGRDTRIAFVTEGVLLRLFQEDPELRTIGVVVFDEFHERNLFSDVALALVKRLQARRPDLGLAVMSATLETAGLAAYLGDCPVVSVTGRQYPVQIMWGALRDPRPIPERVVQGVQQILTAGETGDILVFLPGKGEIFAVQNALQRSRLAESIAVMPLHGELPPEEQDRVFAPHDLRKVIVATNVAETSVTIEGVRFVVDSGQARVARYDAERGVPMLHLEDISRASAEQRAGRAGRTAPGYCYRLWSESNHLNRSERNTPEIARSDLAEVVLLLHSLGIPRAAAFEWLEAPDPGAVAHAETLLHGLGALDPVTGGLTEVGDQLRRLPVHPRFGRMMIAGAGNGGLEMASLAAALLSGRDILLRPGREDKTAERRREEWEEAADSDLVVQMRAWQAAREAGYRAETCRGLAVHGAAAREVEQTWRQLLHLADQAGLGREDPRGAPAVPMRTEESERLGVCVLAGFPDQVACRRDTGTLECLLPAGRQGTLVRESVLAREGAPSWLVALEMKEVSSRGGPRLLVRTASPVKREWLETLFPGRLRWVNETGFDPTQKAVMVRQCLCFDDLVLERKGGGERDPKAVAACLARAAVEGRFHLPNLTHALRQWRARVNLVAEACPDLELPRLDETALAACLARAFHGLDRVKAAQEVRLDPAIHAHLPVDQREWLDELAPKSWKSPSGAAWRIDYPESATDKKGRPQPPVVEAKVIDCWDLDAQPTIAEGRVSMRLRMLKPDGRKLDETDDWPRWKGTEYPRLRAQLRQKFPGAMWR